MPMTLAELLALLPDNTVGAIGADDMRTVTTELYNQGVVPAPVTSVDGETGAVVLTDNYGKLMTTTAVQAGNYTANPNEIVLFDTTAAARTLTLPSAPPNGTQVAARIVTFGTGNFVTVTCGGGDVLDKPGGATSAASALQHNNMSLALLYNAGVWTRLSGFLPLAASDSRYLVAATTPTLAGSTNIEILPPVANVQTIQTTTAANSFINPVGARAATDQIINNNATPQNDAALFGTVQASATYIVDATIFFDAGTTADFRSGWYGPTGSTLDWTLVVGENTGTANAVLWLGALAIGATQQVGGKGVGTISRVHITGTLVTSTTAGTFGYRFAQGAATIEDTTRRAGSFFIAHRIV